MRLGKIVASLYERAKDLLAFFNGIYPALMVVSFDGTPSLNRASSGCLNAKLKIAWLRSEPFGSWQVTTFQLLDS